jgi:predicted porin
MKKILLTLATAAPVAIAFADVNLYGKVAVGLENDQFQNSTVPGTGSVQDYGSYFGIRGSDPVYGEISAIWQVEQFLDLTSGQAYANSTAGGSTMVNPNATFINTGRITKEVNVLAGSESYLGLQGVFGRVRIGNLSNYMRSNMGAVDMYNSGNGVNGLGLWSRTNKVMPTAIKYDSPTWGGFSFSALYSFNTSGQIGVSGVGYTNDFNVGLNGYYSGGIFNIGAGWKYDNYSIKLGTTVYQQVGTYTTGTEGMALPTINGKPYSNAAYANAYASRLELAYNNPDGAIVGVGLQIANGLGWNSWANSGGAFNNVRVSPSYAGGVTDGSNIPGLNNAQYQTQELGASFGWHIAEWTPKIGYVYGNNLMYNGNIASVATGQASQIPNSGYQQLVAELDWNITPKTIAFVNYGQIWYGSLLSNVSYCGASCKDAPIINGKNAYENNQDTVAIGFTHTF